MQDSLWANLESARRRTNWELVADILGVPSEPRTTRARREVAGQKIIECEIWQPIPAYLREHLLKPQNDNVEEVFGPLPAICTSIYRSLMVIRT
jgi:hypothetical protein